MQNEIKLTEFFEKDFVDYSSYDNLRKIASCIDGLKNSSRKVIYTVLDKNIFDLTKVSQLSAKAAEHADYLHGSLDGVVVTLGQDFQGTNQLPLLQKKGNFGTKAIPEPSASRYIFACGSKSLKELFNPLDKPLLIQQTFEGTKIEPMYYVPEMPLLLLNGSNGVSSGFAQKILPRPYDEVKKIIKEFLKTQKSETLDKIDKVSPFTAQFNGNVQRDLSDAEKFKWIFTADFEIDEKKSTVTLHDLPYGENLRSFLKVLDDLEDAKKIKSYEDCTDGDDFKFVVKFAKSEFPKSADAIIKLFKLQTSVTENFTCIDENNKILEALKPSEILKRYVFIKLQYLQRRKDLMLKDLEISIAKYQSMAFFIEAVLDGEDFKKMKSEDFNRWFNENKLFSADGDTQDGFGYLHRIPMGKMAQDEVQKLEKQIEQSKKELKEISEQTIFDLWKEGI